MFLVFVHPGPEDPRDQVPQGFRLAGGIDLDELELVGAKNHVDGLHVTLRHDWLIDGTFSAAAIISHTHLPTKMDVDFCDIVGKFKYLSTGWKKKNEGELFFLLTLRMGP